MSRYLSEEMIERLFVEVTAQRLVIRSLLAYLAVAGGQPLSQLLADLQEAADKTSPDVVPLPDVERHIHEKASALAQERAAQFVRDLGPLALGPKRKSIRAI